MNDYMIDSHKLMLHPKEVSNFLNNNKIYPIYVEVSPIAVCNHRCSFCALDFLEHETGKLDLEKILRSLKEMKELGLKSVMLAGEGEPLLHDKIVEMIKAISEIGLDVAITTNGSLLSGDKLELLKYCKWIKVSVDAATYYTYKDIHGVFDFNSVCDNLIYAVKYKKEYNLNCAIGAQFIVLPENYDEAEKFVDIMKIISVDYAVFKSYSQMKQSNNIYNIKYVTGKDYNKYTFVNGVHYISLDNIFNLKDKYKEFVIVRKNALTKASNEREYRNCYALPFWSYISSNGDVWACSAHMDDNKFCLGNMNNDKMKIILDRNYIRPVDGCRVNCRMNECNKYLNRLINPKKHDNFI